MARAAVGLVTRLLGDMVSVVDTGVQVVPGYYTMILLSLGLELSGDQ